MVVGGTTGFGFINSVGLTGAGGGVCLTGLGVVAGGVGGIGCGDTFGGGVFTGNGCVAGVFVSFDSLKIVGGAGLGAGFLINSNGATGFGFSISGGLVT